MRQSIYYQQNRGEDSPRRSYHHQQAPLKYRGVELNSRYAKQQLVDFSKTHNMSQVNKKIEITPVQYSHVQTVKYKNTQLGYSGRNTYSGLQETPPAAQYSNKQSIQYSSYDARYFPQESFDEGQQTPVSFNKEEQFSPMEQFRIPKPKRFESIQQYNERKIPRREQVQSEDHFVLEDLSPRVYRELRQNMEQFLQVMVKKIRTESERSVSPMPQNRRINGEYSRSMKTSKSLFSDIYQDEKPGFSSVVSPQVIESKIQKYEFQQQVNVINMEIQKQQDYGFFKKKTMQEQLIKLDISDINIEPTMPKKKKIIETQIIKQEVEVNPEVVLKKARKTTPAVKSQSRRPNSKASPEIKVKKVVKEQAQLTISPQVIDPEVIPQSLKKEKVVINERYVKEQELKKLLEQSKINDSLLEEKIRKEQEKREQVKKELQMRMEMYDVSPPDKPQKVSASDGKPSKEAEAQIGFTPPSEKSYYANTEHGRKTNTYEINTSPYLKVNRDDKLGHSQSSPNFKKSEHDIKTFKKPIAVKISNSRQNDIDFQMMEEIKDADQNKSMNIDILASGEKQDDKNYSQKLFSDKSEHTRFIAECFESKTIDEVNKLKKSPIVFDQQVIRQKDRTTFGRGANYETPAFTSPKFEDLQKSVGKGSDKQESNKSKDAKQYISSPPIKSRNNSSPDVSPMPKEKNSLSKINTPTLEGQKISATLDDPDLTATIIEPDSASLVVLQQQQDIDKYQTPVFEPKNYFQDLLDNHFGIFISSIISNLFSPFPADCDFTKLKYNQQFGLLKEYMTQLLNPSFIPEYLPSFDIYKLSRLNKSFKAQLDAIIAPLSWKDIYNYNQVVNCVQMLEKKPDISKFKRLSILKEMKENPNSNHICNEALKHYKHLEDSMSNSLYGNSVFSGIHDVDPNNEYKLRNLKNSLLETIVQKRNNNAGYYTLLNVRMSVFTYCDIYIMLDGEAEKAKGIEKLKEWSLKQKQIHEEPNENDKNYIDATEFEECLSGIARIIYYRKNRNDENYKVIDMIEGEFKKGFVDGFARHIELRKVNCDIYTNCKVGFWSKQEHDGRAIVVPYGKWAWFTTNQKNETLFKCPSGIYVGAYVLKKIGVLHCQSIDFQSFNRNILPASSYIKKQPKNQIQQWFFTKQSYIWM